MKLRNKKTGEIWENAKIATYSCGDKDSVSVCQNAFAGLGRTYESLAELNEDWEDYKPAEPLIKDEKIRKAVRAWVDFNQPHELFVVDVNRIVDEKNNEIKFSGQPFCGLVSMQPTITELCGKEEE